MTESRQRIHLFLLAVIVSFVVSVLVVFMLYRGSVPDLTGELTYDFGRIEVGPDRIERQHSFVLLNETDQWIRIEGLTPGCSCTEATVDINEVGPGGDVLVSAVMKPSERSGKQVVPINMRINWSEAPSGSTRTALTLNVIMNTRRVPPLWSTYPVIELQSSRKSLDIKIAGEEGEIGSNDPPAPLTAVSPEGLAVAIEPWKLARPAVAAKDRPALFEAPVSITRTGELEVLPDEMPIVFQSGEDTYTLTVRTVPLLIDGLNQPSSETILPLSQPQSPGREPIRLPGMPPLDSSDNENQP